METTMKSLKYVSRDCPTQMNLVETNQVLQVAVHSMKKSRDRV